MLCEIDVYDGCVRDLCKTDVQDDSVKKELCCRLFVYASAVC